MAFAFGGYTGPAPTSAQKQPVLLIDMFYSYASAASVQEHLKKLGLPWSVVENSQLPAGDRRPRFDMVTISVAHFEYLGDVGELQLRFFNDRLMSTWFFPGDSGSFRHLLESKLKVSLAREATIPPFTRIWTDKDYKGRIYFGWEDSRLAREQSLWLEKYS